MANPLVIPCSTPPADCAPCFVSPIANLSSEQPDRQVFLAGSWTSQQPVLDPPNGTTWDAFGCISFCESTISQEDANLCAQRQQIYCNTGGWHNPTPGGPPPTIFLSHSESCTTICPDGLPFTFTVPAGTFAALSQVLADRMAFSYACNQAELHRMCLSVLSQTSGCVGTPFSATVTATGRDIVSPITWQVISGSLPPGLTLGGFSPSIDVEPGTSETIKGTPTTAGTYTFTLMAQGSDGIFMEKQYTICIVGITPTTLPGATVGIAYSQTLSVNACATNPTFTLIGGLPTGLTLNSTTGVISGTPTNAGTFNFTVQCSTLGMTCSQNYTIVSTSNDLCVNAADWATIVAAAAAAPFPGPFSVGPAHFVFQGSIPVNNWIGQANPPTFPQTSISQTGPNSWQLVIATHAPTNATWTFSGSTTPSGTYSLTDPDGIPGLPATIRIAQC